MATRGKARVARARKPPRERVRDSEARFRGLANLSADWLWEQDADYRFTRLEGRNVAGGDPQLLARLMGRRRWETGLSVAGGWTAHRAVLRARQPFHEVTMWRTMADGSVRYMSVSGEPVFDAKGRFTGYRGAGRDVTAQKRWEAMLRLEHMAAQRLANARAVDEALHELLHGVCESQGWDRGRYFPADLVGEDKTGMAERTRDSAAPMWAPGERALLVPVPAEGAVLGVLRFSAAHMRRPESRLLQSMSRIASQLGQFLRRADAEARLRESEARFRSLTQMSSDFYWETDAAHRFTQLVYGPGYKAAQLGDNAIDSMRSALESKTPFRDFEFTRALPDGTRYFSLSGEPYFGVDGDFLGYRGVGRDVTEIALAREHIASLAYSDPLTGLANRTSLGPSLEQSVQRTRRRKSKLAVLFIDLDGFKQVNDAYGHDAGDALLVEVGKRLRSHLRESDLVARLGGDEFVVVVEEMQDAARAEVVARKLLGEMVRPFAGSGRKLSLSASIGISVYPDDASDAAALMKHADTAMYRAKQAGKNTCCFYRAAIAA